VEWQVQELTAASATNYHNEGATTATAAATPTSRVGNYHQISKKVFATSGTKLFNGSPVLNQIAV